MNVVFLDCDLMRFPNSGLYYYCLNLGEELYKQTANDEDLTINMYVPAAEKNTFFHHTTAERKWHKLWKPFLKKNSIWHTPFQSGRMFVDKAIRPDIRTVLTIHDLNFLHEGKTQQEQEKSLAHTQKLIDRNDVLICISDFTKNDVLKHCNIREKPIYTIHNGCNPIHPPTRKPTAIQTNQAFLFGLGYVNRKKNYKVLIPLLQSNPNLDLVISGKPDDADYITEMKEYAKLLGASDRLHITGAITEEEKAWYMSNCLAFFQPSLAEGFGFPVLEAMSVGKPVFISNRTSLPEIGGEAAFYLNNFEAESVNKVFATGIKHFFETNMKGSVIARAQQFRWENRASQYIHVYKSLLQ